MENPYAPPRTSASPTPPPLDATGQRSAVPRVLGILSIISSGLALLLGLLFVGTTVAAYKATREIERQFKEHRERQRQNAKGDKALRGDKSGKSDKGDKGDKRDKGKRLDSSAPARVPTSTKRPIPTMIGALLITATLSLGTIALLVLGIGQVRYRPWSYRFSVIWSWAVIVGLVAGGGLVALRREGVIAALMLIPLLVYPVVTLSLVTGRRARASLGR